MAISAINESINNYKSGSRSSILFAQMQSGKTSAFLLLAGEMIRTKIVDNVVIFTGNRERELKEQLQTQVKGNSTERSFFDKKYVRFLETNTEAFNGISFSEAGDIIQEIKDKVMIVWGTELSKKISLIPKENTLFIYEESHFAQTVGQTPSKFLKDIGLPVNGDNDILENKNNYICSVSATPFSELCDNGNFEQSKKVIRMIPGDGYRGVKWLKENNKIIKYSNWTTSLREALNSKKEECNWAIIRVRKNEHAEIAEQICKRAEWTVRKYDQDHSEIINMLELEQKPVNPTVIILRERCRMGTVVPKNYLSFVFETSMKTKTDTLLQGLLGRACGYHTNDNLLVYINKDLIESGEIDLYIDFCDGVEESVPTNAKNIISENNSVIVRKGNKIRSPVIPIHIPRRCISEQATFKEKEAVMNDIINALITDSEVIQNNQNPENIKQKIIDMLQQTQLNSDASHSVSRHRLDNPSYRHVPEKLLKAIQTKTPSRFGSSCGAGSSINESGCTMFYVNKPILGLETESYYLCFELKLTQDELMDMNSLRIKKLPTTTGLEIFRYNNRQETGTDNVSNGGFCYYLRPESATDESVMLNTINECILRSKETETELIVESKITSIRQPGFERYTGIYVSCDVYISLLSGLINKKMKETFGVTLKITKSRGRSVNMPPGCLYRLSEISW